MGTAMWRFADCDIDRLWRQSIKPVFSLLARSLL
jgi:hypothetical protein